jgi:hypothetical protein
MASVVISGDTSGAITVSAPAVAGTNTLTLPAVTDTLTGIAATQTLTNKTLTSPVLTTPNLGTPSALVLTNATGLPAAQLTGTQTIPKATLPTGSVLQVVQGSTTTVGTSTNNSTWVSTSLSASITPISSASKILIFGQHGSVRINSSSNGISIRILRNSTSIAQPVTELLYNSNGIDVIAPFQYLDSPATTSSVTYSTEFKLLTGTGGTGQINANSVPAYITLMEISA